MWLASEKPLTLFTALYFLVHTHRTQVEPQAGKAWPRTKLSVHTFSSLARRTKRNLFTLCICFSSIAVWIRLRWPSTWWSLGGSFSSRLVAIIHHSALSVTVWDADLHCSGKRCHVDLPTFTCSVRNSLYVLYHWSTWPAGVSLQTYFLSYFYFFFDKKKWTKKKKKKRSACQLLSFEELFVYAMKVYTSIQRLAPMFSCFMPRHPAPFLSSLCSITSSIKQWRVLKKKKKVVTSQNGVVKIYLLRITLCWPSHSCPEWINRSHIIGMIWYFLISVADWWLIHDWIIGCWPWFRINLQTHLGTVANYRHFVSNERCSFELKPPSPLLQTNTYITCIWKNAAQEMRVLSTWCGTHGGVQLSEVF